MMSLLGLFLLVLRLYGASSARLKSILHAKAINTISHHEIDRNFVEALKLKDTPFHTSEKDLIRDGVRRQGKRADRCSHSNADAIVMPNTPMGPNCPASCPFSQPLAGDKCAKVCIAAENCREFHPARRFGDQRTKTCVPTCGAKLEHRIAGCEECAGEGICKRCITSVYGEFWLSSDGKTCTNPMHYFWIGIYVVLGIIVLIIIWYLVGLMTRPVTNDHVSSLALVHRHRAYPLTQTNNKWHAYSLLWTNPHWEDISGLGVILYFNWLIFAACSALLLYCGAKIAIYYSADLYEQQEALRDLKCYMMDYTDEHTELVESALKFEHLMFQWLATAYACIVVASWIFMAIQKRVQHNKTSRDITPSEYAVYLTRLPYDLDDEASLKNAVESKIGENDAVVGVSICWSVGQDNDDIVEVMDDWVTELDRDALHASPSSSTVQDQPSDQSDQPSWRLPVFDKYLLEPDKPFDKPDLSAELFSKLESSGNAFVVLNTERLVKKFVAALEEDATLSLMTKQGPSVVTVGFRRPQSEPTDVYWPNYDNQANFAMRLAGGVVTILAVICVWAILYIPYALEYVQYTRVPGEAPGAFTDLLLGALIGIGNVIVGNVIEAVIGHAGFHFKDRRDLCVLALAFFANLLNVVADLWMTMEIAKGAQMDEAFTGDAVGYDTVVAREMYVLIVPSYLFTPYIVQPLFETLLPYWLYRWLIRSNSLVHRRQAERCMEAPEFDIVWRYADILNNFTICTLLLFFVNPTCSTVMMWLLAFVVFMYVQDKYRLLRACTQTSYTTHRLSTAFAFWWVVPTAVIATVVAWWGKKADVPKAWGLPLFVDEHLLWIAPLVHALIYLGVLFITFHIMDFEVPRDENKIYSEASEGVVEDYFNTNLVHCLRSRSTEKVVIPWLRGKSYLQPGAAHKFSKDVDYFHMQTQDSLSSP